MASYLESYSKKFSAAEVIDTLKSLNLNDSIINELIERYHSQEDPSNENLFDILIKVFSESLAKDYHHFKSFYMSEITRFYVLHYSTIENDNLEICIYSFDEYHKMLNDTDYDYDYDFTFKFTFNSFDELAEFNKSALAANLKACGFAK